MGDLFPGWNRAVSSPQGLTEVATPVKQLRLTALKIDPMYSAQLLDHFQNPRNAGELSDADAVKLCGLLDRLGCSCGETQALAARDGAPAR